MAEQQQQQQQRAGVARHPPEFQQKLNFPTWFKQFNSATTAI